MNYLEVIEGLCRVCIELAEIVRLQACDPAFHADDAEARLAAETVLPADSGETEEGAQE